MQHTDVLSAPGYDILNVTLLEPRMKHPTIFKRFDDLAPGQSFTIVNDHDPKPLYYQMIAERGNTFSWSYAEDGPDLWKVVIRKNDMSSGPTLGELAASDIRKAEVFKKYGLDFCCGGKKSLKQACEEKQLDVEQIEMELKETDSAGKAKGAFNFNRWDLDFLADYIFNEHHQYWYAEEPVLSQLIEKVANHHGQHYPYLKEVEKVYNTLRTELNAHFTKEERVLFPYIKELVIARNNNSSLRETGLDSIKSPIQMMEADHEAAGELLADLNTLTNGYTLPEGACNSFALVYHKLKNLEEDLHQHIHLENNILFPKAERLENELLNR